MEKIGEEQLRKAKKLAASPAARALAQALGSSQTENLRAAAAAGDQQRLQAAVAELMQDPKVAGLVRSLGGDADA